MRKIIANLKTYWRYFCYIQKHKGWVFIEAMKMGLWIHAFTHDLSKFLPSEFFPYAVKFYGGDYAYKYGQVEHDFELAWWKHYKRNKHHWNYWIKSEGPPIGMSDRYIKQMIADWRAMGRQHGNSAPSFYRANEKKMKIARDTRIRIESILSDEEGEPVWIKEMRRKS